MLPVPGTIKTCGGYFVVMSFTSSLATLSECTVIRGFTPGIQFSKADVKLNDIRFKCLFVFVSTRRDNTHSDKRLYIWNTVY